MNVGTIMRPITYNGADDDDNNNDDSHKFDGCIVDKKTVTEGPLCALDMSPEVHCNLCNHCYTLGMPGSRPEIRCVQYLPKST